MDILVCGSRTWWHLDLVYAVLDGISQSERGSVLVVTGDAFGADQCARMWAEDRGKHLSTVFADWGRYGEAAGPERNARMAAALVETEQRGEAAIALGFVDKPLEESRGTHDMLTRAQATGVPTYLIRRLERS